MSHFILSGGPYRHIVIEKKERISASQRFPVSTYIGVVVVCASGPEPVRIGTMTGRLGAVKDVVADRQVEMFIYMHTYAT